MVWCCLLVWKTQVLESVACGWPTSIGNSSITTRAMTSASHPSPSSSSVMRPSNFRELVWSSTSMLDVSRKLARSPVGRVMTCQKLSAARGAVQFDVDVLSRNKKVACRCKRKHVQSCCLKRVRAGSAICDSSVVVPEGLPSQNKNVLSTITATTWSDEASDEGLLYGHLVCLNCAHIV
jgi:hypothetical protein